MNMRRLGIDLAKNSYSLCGVDVDGHILLEKTLNRKDLLPFLSQFPACEIGMECGSGAHYWAREFSKLGHMPRIMAPRFVVPYRSQGKNDRNDARAICEAMSRPGMRFVPPKSDEQQAILAVHRLRSSCVAENTQLANQLRGLLAEFGVVIPKGVKQLRRNWSDIRQQCADRVPAMAWEELDELYARFLSQHQLVLSYDRKINALVRVDERCQRLLQLQGIGPITASAVVATVGNARDFKNGRHRNPGTRQLLL